MLFASPCGYCFWRLFTNSWNVSICWFSVIGFRLLVFGCWFSVIGSNVVKYQKPKTNNQQPYIHAKLIKKSVFRAFSSKKNGVISGHLYNHVWAYTKSVMFFVLIRNEISQWIPNTKYLPNVCCQHICWNGLNWPMLRWSPRKRQPHKIRKMVVWLWNKISI